MSELSDLDLEHVNAGLSKPQSACLAQCAAGCAAQCLATPAQANAAVSRAARGR